MVVQETEVNPSEALKSAILNDDIEKAKQIISTIKSHGRDEHSRDERVFNLLNTRADDGILPLYRAIHIADIGNKDLNIIQLLIDNHAVDILPSIHGRRALLRAAASNRLDILKLLLTPNKFGPLILDINLTGPNGATALHLAASKGNLEAVKLLIQSGAKDSLDSRGRSAADIAAKYGHAELSKFIAKRFPKPEVFQPLAKPQVVSMKSQDLKESPRTKAKFIEEKAPNSVKKKFWKNYNVLGKQLWLAVATNDLPTAKKLLAQGVDPNLPIDVVFKDDKLGLEQIKKQSGRLNPIPGTRLLHIAANNSDMVEILLAHAANPNLANSQHVLPTHGALVYRSWKSVTLLLPRTNYDLFYSEMNNSPLYNTGSRNGLMLAFIDNDPKKSMDIPESIVKFLVEEWGEDINAPIARAGGPIFAETICNIAMMNKAAPETIQLLLDYGAKPNGSALTISNYPEDNKYPSKILSQVIYPMLAREDEEQFLQPELVFTAGHMAKFGSDSPLYLHFAKNKIYDPNLSRMIIGFLHNPNQDQDFIPDPPDEASSEEENSRDQNFESDVHSSVGPSVSSTEQSLAPAPGLDDGLPIGNLPDDGDPEIEEKKRYAIKHGGQASDALPPALRLQSPDRSSELQSLTNATNTSTPRFLGPKPKNTKGSTEDTVLTTDPSSSVRDAETMTSEDTILGPDKFMPSHPF